MISRKEVLNLIESFLRGREKWLKTNTLISLEYETKATALIELLEINEIGSINSVSMSIKDRYERLKAK